VVTGVFDLQLTNSWITSHSDKLASATIKERMMSKLVVNLNLTLDGVMQAPGRADEDTRGDFAYGGWATPYFHPSMFTPPADGKMPALLFGRRTYEDFYKVWPNRTDNPFTAVLDNSQKYVASKTLAEPLPWQNSTLLKGNTATAIAALKKELDGNLVVLGSGELVRSLMPYNLVDEYILSIHPLVLGTGQRLFPDGISSATFQLADTRSSPTGVVIATYHPAEPTAGKVA
jgi:dihydrofolate reductase